ncbi:MAG: hypothetical protein HY835_03485, partial [Anaerolineae bacterium]|nr:hypothetical protein [Anaerolineae bacterium]
MKNLRIPLAFLLWTLLILAGYYYYHKPITPDQVMLLALTIWDLAASLLILSICGGLGRLVFPRLSAHGMVGASLQAAMGCGIASLFWLGLGFARLYHGWLALILTLLTAILLRRSIRAWLSAFGEWRAIWSPLGAFGRVLLVAAAILCLNQLWIALAPPVKYDALTYHLSLPAAYEQAGRLTFLPENPYWGHPQLVEMLYTWAGLLNRSSTAGVFSWMAGVTFLCGLAGFTRRITPVTSPGTGKPELAAVASVAFVLAGATARWMLGWSYSDLFSAWMGLGVCFCWLIWRDERQPAWLLAAGVFCGFAVSTKFTAGIAAIALGLAILAFRKPAGAPWRTVLLSATLSLAVFAPWAIKNLIFTGNPIFPYAFPTPWYSSDRLAAANLPPESVSLLAQVTLPVYATWMGVDSAPGPSTDLGPLLVLFALPAVLLSWRNLTTRFFVLTLGVTWVVLAVGGLRFPHLQQPRLYFVVLPALAWLAGWGFVLVSALQTGGVRLNRIASAIAGIVLVFALWQDAVHLLSSGAVTAVTGVTSRETYVKTNTGVYWTAMQTIHELPTSERILFLWEARSLYAPFNTQADAWIDRWRADIRALGSAEAVLQAWKYQGYTQILLNVDGMKFMRENDAG